MKIHEVMRKEGEESKKDTDVEEEKKTKVME
jgi:hypothetical protein